MQTASPTLKRSLSAPLIAFYALGTILGAGIYALVGKVAGSAGLYAPVSFLLAAVVALFTGLSYAELAARFPRSAGAALYVQEGLHWPLLSLIVGLLVIATGVVSAATLTHAFAGYLRVFVAWPDVWVMSALVIAMGLIALWGIGESVRIAAAITLIELSGLFTVLWAGRGTVAELPARLAELPPVDGGVVAGVVLGAFLAFYAFIGFEDTANVAEEVVDPARNIPRAIIGSLAVATLLYISVALVAVAALPLQELTASRAPLALVYERATGGSANFIAAVSLFAVLNGAMIQIIMASRVLYGMSREGWLPGFARLHARTRTPVLATMVVAATVLALSLWLDIVVLAKATSFIILLVFALINLSLLRVRRRMPAPLGVRSYPVWVPALGIATTLGLVIFQVVTLWRGA